MGQVFNKLSLKGGVKQVFYGKWLINLTYLQLKTLWKCYHVGVGSCFFQIPFNEVSL